MDERRAAEERLLARYEHELTAAAEIAPEERTLWPVPPGRVQLFETESGAHVEELGLEGAFPDTRFVLIYRHQLRPGHRFALRWSVWPDDGAAQADPPFNDVLAVNLRESILTQIHRARPLLSPDA